MQKEAKKALRLRESLMSKEYDMIYTFTHGNMREKGHEALKEMGINIETNTELPMSMREMSHDCARIGRAHV